MMSFNLRFPSLARVAILSAALAVPALTAAHADDEYNSGRVAVTLQSAASGSPFHSVRDAARTQEDARLASSAKTLPGQRDLVGAGGRQDNVANDIYHPGRTVGFGG
jgi:hypothetical protein